MPIKTSYPAYGRIVIYPYGKTIPKEVLFDDTDKSQDCWYKGDSYSFDEDPYDASSYKTVQGEPDDDDLLEISTYIADDDVAYTITTFVIEFPQPKTLYRGNFWFRIWYKADVAGKKPRFKVYPRAVDVDNNTYLLSSWDTDLLMTDTSYQVVEFGARWERTENKIENITKINVEIKIEDYYSYGYTVTIACGTSQYDSRIYIPPKFYTLYEFDLSDIDIQTAQTQLDAILNVTLNDYDCDLVLALDDTILSEIEGWKPTTYGTKEVVKLAEKMDLTGKSGKLKFGFRSTFATISLDYAKSIRYHYYNQSEITPRDFGKEILFLWKSVLPPQSGVILNDSMDEFLYNESTTTDEYLDFSDSPFLLKVDKVKVIEGNPILYFIGR